MEEKSLLRRWWEFFTAEDDFARMYRYYDGYFEWIIFVVLNIIATLFVVIGFAISVVSLPIWVIPYLVYKEWKRKKKIAELNRAKCPDPVRCYKCRRMSTSELVRPVMYYQDKEYICPECYRKYQDMLDKFMLTFE